MSMRSFGAGSSARLDPHHTAPGDDGLEGSPVGAGQDALLGGHQVGNCSRAVLTALARALFGRPASRGQAAQAPNP